MKRKKGQIIVLLALLMVVILGFVALGIDAGGAYTVKAKLSRATDAAALRMVNNFGDLTLTGTAATTEEEMRRDMVFRVFQANYQDFFNGTDPLWETSPAPGNATDSGGRTDTAYYSYPAGSSKEGLVEKFTINTKQAALGVLEVRVTAESGYRAFFAPALGALVGVSDDSFTIIRMTDTATSARYPTVNIVILDQSGSMLNNNGYSVMAGAVDEFAKAFSDSRDYLLVISFSSTYDIIWPAASTAVNGYVSPGLNYNQPSASDASKSEIYVAVDNMPYAGATNGAIGMREAFEQMDYFYEQLKLSNQVLAEKLRINYVFMTDGKFNRPATSAPRLRGRPCPMRRSSRRISRLSRSLCRR